VFWWYFAGDRPSVPVAPDSVSEDRSGRSDAAIEADKAKTDKAREEKTRSEEEIPWRLIFSKAPVWAIIVGHFCNNWGLYVLLSWLPSYFSSQMGVNLRSVWVFVAPPWIAGFLCGNLAGWIADRMIAAGYAITFTRKVIQTVAFLGPALALGALATTSDAVTAVVLLSIAIGLASFTFAGAGCNHLDISPRHAGVIFGISNTAATIPGIVGVALTGFLVDKTGSYASAFYLTAGVYLFGLVVYLIFGSARRIL